MIGTKFLDDFILQSPTGDKKMDINTLKESTSSTRPPDGLSVLLQAMWHQHKGNWAEAHCLAQAENSQGGSWVHAHLHRAEGDLNNAAYWYRLADKPFCTLSVEDEWRAIVSTLLKMDGWEL